MRHIYALTLAVALLVPGLASAQAEYRTGAGAAPPIYSTPPSCPTVGIGARYRDSDESNAVYVCRAGGWVAEAGEGGGGSASLCPAGDTACKQIAATNICASLQTAFNQLLDPNQVGGLPKVATIAAPPAGTYDCDQRVRYCLSTGTTAGANAPACDDTTTAYPELRGVGEWDRVEIKGDWTADAGTNVYTPVYWQPSASGPDAIIWIGDLYATENTSRLVKVDFPSGLWVETGGGGPRSSAWERHAPLFCDGCTGRIGYRSRSAAFGAMFQMHQFPIFVGRDLGVRLDIRTPVWTGEGTSQAPTVIGDRMVVSGVHRQETTDAGSQLRFGQATAGAESMFVAAGDPQAYGDTGAIVFDGIYETTPDFVGANGVALPGVQSATLRGEFGRRGAAGGTNKPWVDASAYATARTSHITLDGLFHSDAQFNANVRFTGGATTFAEQARKHARLTVGPSAVFDMRNWAATNIGHAPIHCHQSAYGIPCDIEISRAASRIGRHQWAQWGYSKRYWPQYGGPHVLHPLAETRTVVVSGTAVSGNCVKGMNGGSASIGACAAGDEIRVTEPTIINYQRLDLLEARPASSQCLVAVEQTVHPGDDTWVNGPTEPADCTAANAPHTGCTGAGAGTLRLWGFSWRKLEYGRAASAAVYQKRTTEAYDFDEQAGSVVLQPGQAWRVRVQPMKTCSGGSAGTTDTLDWQCATNADCLSTGTPGTRTCNTVGTCGDLGLSRISVQTFPAMPEPACFDGVDNDGDGLVDYPQDTQCASYDDVDEAA